MWNGSTAPEVAQRLAALRRCWGEMGRFWGCAAPAKFKRIVFGARMVNSAMSGMESYGLLA